MRVEYFSSLLMDAGKLEIVDGVVAIVGAVASAHYQEFNGVKVW